MLPIRSEVTVNRMSATILLEITGIECKRGDRLRLEERGCFSLSLSLVLRVSLYIRLSFLFHNSTWLDIFRKTKMCVDSAWSLWLYSTYTFCTSLWMLFIVVCISYCRSFKTKCTHVYNWALWCTCLCIQNVSKVWNYPIGWIGHKLWPSIP